MPRKLADLSARERILSLPFSLSPFVFFFAFASFRFRSRFSCFASGRIRGEATLFKAFEGGGVPPKIARELEAPGSNEGDQEPPKHPQNLRNELLGPTNMT